MGIYIFEPGGSTPPANPQSFQDVLNVDSVLNKNNDIDCDSYALSITNSSNFQVSDYSGYLLLRFQDNTGYDLMQNNILFQVSQVGAGINTIPLNLVMNANDNAIFLSLSTNYDSPGNKFGFNIETRYASGEFTYTDFWIGDKNKIISNPYGIGQYIDIRNTTPRMIFNGKYFRFQHDTGDEDATAKLEFNGLGWNYTGATKTTTKHLIIYVDNIEYVIPLLQRN